MLFNKHFDYPWYWSPRKEAALVRKLQRQVDQAPLFGDEIKEEQPTIEAVKAERKDAWEAKEAKARIDRAREWRRARSKLFALPKAHRLFIRRWWRSSRWRTREPHYFADFIHQYVVNGKRPEKWAIEKYGELLQPVDYCTVRTPVRIPPSIKGKKQTAKSAQTASTEEQLSLTYSFE